MRRRVPHAFGRFLRDLGRQVASLFRRRPTIEVQAEPADCGYICISAVMALLGRPMLVQAVKERTGPPRAG